MAHSVSEVLNQSAGAGETVENTQKPYPFLANESESLIEALNTLRQSKTGRQLLEDAEKYGTRIETACLNSSYGSFNDEEKLILINAGSEKERMVTTLAHELRHSQQFQNGVLLNALSDNPKDYIHSQRAIEADANVIACQVGWELQQQGNPEPLKTFATEGRDVLSAFIASAEKGGVESGEAHGKAFYAWFNDTELLECYENNYIRNFERRKSRATSQEMEAALQRRVPVLENIERFCKFEGKTYLNPQEADEFFKRPEQNSVTHETYWAIYRNMRDALHLGLFASKEEVMEKAGGFTERVSSTWYYDVSKNQDREQKLARRQQEAAAKISGRRSLNSLPTNGAKTPDLTTVALLKKKNFIQK